MTVLLKKKDLSGQLQSVTEGLSAPAEVDGMDEVSSVSSQVDGLPWGKMSRSTVGDRGLLGLRH